MAVKRVALLLLVVLLCLLTTTVSTVDAKSKKTKDCRKGSSPKAKACRKPSKQNRPSTKKPSSKRPPPPRPSSQSPVLPASPPPPPPPPPQSPYMISYDIVRIQDWDPTIFTQGIEITKACDACPTRIFTSSGLSLTDFGIPSFVAVKDVDTGATIASTQLGDSEFGEGVTVLDGKLYQVVWQSSSLKVYDAQSLQLIDTKNHPMADGWGITDNGSELIVSDGSSKLVYVNPNNPSDVVREIRVRFQGKDVSYLNELEYVDGFMYANVWRTNCVAKIDANTGEVVGWLDASPLRAMIDESLSPPPPYEGFDHTLNGIAAAAGETGTELAITGKYWNKLVRIKETGATVIAGNEVEAIMTKCVPQL